MTTQKSAIAKLVRQLNEAHQERDSLNAKWERSQELLARANDRIAQLSSPTGGKGSTVVPGVSRKVLESMTKENNFLDPSRRTRSGNSG